MLQQQEQPIYILPQKTSRALIPKILSLLGLGVIFYLGILLNLSLLNLRAGEESVVKMIGLGVVLGIIVLGIYLGIHHAKLSFRFYNNRIMQGKKQIMYREIVNTKRTQNFIDKIFKTYSIDLGNNFQLKHISSEINIENYVQQLIQYTRQAQPQI
ncbi:hypothetical protein COV12_02510 [Candidatus Woesearchaeota archaeon CG10_big_fil_rev_8_21_14_0_10_32_24]|nr:MAG: hypothetical protein COV12_02510 [Candidatus Woesearchaeota archaeon CG10_big_fil_rev_8_21_14_0_10_32_24]